MDYEAMTGVEEPGYRKVAAVIAFILPVVVVGAGAAWFIRSFIAPPMIAIPEPMVLASAEPTVPEPPPVPVAQPAPPPVPIPETFGVAVRQPEPTRPLPTVGALGNPSATPSIWPNVVPPAAPTLASAGPAAETTPASLA